MLVSAVLDPSAFDSDYFDNLYRIHAEDFLKGIIENGVLIVDSEGELREAFIKQIECLPGTAGQYLQILLAELLKIEPRRFVACCVLSNGTASDDLLELACHLKKDTEADVLIVGPRSLETLTSEQENVEGVIPLSKYRDSDFEKCRQKYRDGLGSIDTLSEPEVENMIIRTVRFSKCLEFYDRHIGQRTNTCHFYAGIEYILSLWRKHGFFVSDQDFGKVKIYACSVDCILAGDTDSKKNKNKRKNKEQYENIVREIITPLEVEENSPWSVKILIKDDPDNIFHARYLESEHAVVRVDRGFRLFKQGRKFRQNLFTLNMMESSVVRRYQNLPNAVIKSVS